MDNFQSIPSNRVDGFDLAGHYYCGICTYTFPFAFCPQGPGRCTEPVGVMCKEWPAVNYVSFKLSNIF